MEDVSSIEAELRALGEKIGKVLAWVSVGERLWRVRERLEALIDRLVAVGPDIAAVGAADRCRRAERRLRQAERAWWRGDNGRVDILLADVERELELAGPAIANLEFKAGGGEP